METGKLKVHKVILTILYKKTIEMIIDSEGREIKFVYLKIILQNKYSRLPSFLATVDYVSHESELLTRFHSGQILHNEREISSAEVQTPLP